MARKPKTQKQLILEYESLIEIVLEADYEGDKRTARLTRARLGRLAKKMTQLSLLMVNPIGFCRTRSGKGGKNAAKNHRHDTI